MERAAGLLLLPDPPLLSKGGKVFFELWVLRMGASQQGCVRAGAGRSSQVTGTGRARKRGVHGAGFGGCGCCSCVSSNTVNGVSQGVNSLMGQPGAPLHSKGSNPTELTVTGGVGEQGQSRFSALRVLFHST